MSDSHEYLTGVEHGRARGREDERREILEELGRYLKDLPVMESNGYGDGLNFYDGAKAALQAAIRGLGDRGKA